MVWDRHRGGGQDLSGAWVVHRWELAWADVPLHRTRHEWMSPPPSHRCKSRPRGFMHCSRVVPIGWTQSAPCQPAWGGGVMKTSWSGLWYKGWGCRIPSMGFQVVPAAGHPLCRFVPHSICSGRGWPDRRVLPQNPEFWQAHVGPILDIVFISHIDVAV
jgi:hypothetical protein